MTQVLDSGAVLSADGLYRYALWRTWCAGPVVFWIMLNPSTADAEVDDPTIRRCVGFARRWGFGGVSVRNLFAMRATDPRALRAVSVAAAVGPENDAHLLAFAGVGRGDLHVAAWGAHGDLHDRDKQVISLLCGAGVDLHQIGLTAKGMPRHPLYVRGDTRPQLLHGGAS